MPYALIGSAQSYCDCDDPLLTCNETEGLLLHCRSAQSRPFAPGQSGQLNSVCFSPYASSKRTDRCPPKAEIQTETLPAKATRRVKPE